MRKLAVFFILSMLFLGCDVLWFKDSTIVNESSYDVTFKAKKADKVTVQSGQSITIQNDIGADSLEYFESTPPKRVDFVVTDTYKGKFVDLPSISVVIYNTLSIPVTLSADGCLGVDPMPNVQSGDNNTNTIFSKNPIFSVITDTFPATADFQIVNDIMYVTIR